MPKRQTLWTLTRIAEHLGVPTHRVRYIVNSRGIVPVDRAGIARVFDDSSVQMIGSILNEQDSTGANA